MPGVHVVLLTKGSVWRSVQERTYVGVVYCTLCSGVFPFHKIVNCWTPTRGRSVNIIVSVADKKYVYTPTSFFGWTTVERVGFPHPPYSSPDHLFFPSLFRPVRLRNNNARLHRKLLRSTNVRTCKAVASGCSVDICVINYYRRTTRFERLRTLKTTIWFCSFKYSTRLRGS